MSRKKKKLLTPREEQVLELYMDAKSQATIASYLNISVSAVKTYTSSLLKKHNCSSTLELVVHQYKLLLDLE